MAVQVRDFSMNHAQAEAEQLENLSVHKLAHTAQNSIATQIRVQHPSSIVKSSPMQERSQSASGLQTDCSATDAACVRCSVAVMRQEFAHSTFEQASTDESPAHLLA